MRRIHIKLLKLLSIPFVLLLRCLAFAMPRKDDEICIGAWLGDFYCDNPKYFLAEALESGKFRITWIGKSHVREMLPKSARLAFARKGSLLACWRLLRAGTWISCQGSWADLTGLPLRGRALLINLWHGIPLKLTGRNAPKNIQNCRGSGKIASFIKSYVCGNTKEWLAVSSRKAAEILVDGEPEHYSHDRILPFGFPRNDFLVNNRNNTALKDSLRRKYAALLRFSPSSKIVLYMPTFRKLEGGDIFTFYSLPDDDQKDFARILSGNTAVLIEKHHYITYRDRPLPSGKSKCSISVGPEMQKDVDIQELLLVADVLIGDYSGGMVDFGLVRRQSIYFVYDFDQYKSSDSGLVPWFEDSITGPEAKTISELKVALATALESPVFAPAKHYADIVEYEKGTASKQIMHFIATKQGIRT